MGAGAPGAAAPAAHACRAKLCDARPVFCRFVAREVCGRSTRVGRVGRQILYRGGRAGTGSHNVTRCPRPRRAQPLGATRLGCGAATDAAAGRRSAATVARALGVRAQASRGGDRAAAAHTARPHGTQLHAGTTEGARRARVAKGCALACRPPATAHPAPSAPQPPLTTDDPQLASRTSRTSLPPFSLPPSSLPPSS